MEETAALFDGEPEPQNAFREAGDPAVTPVSRGIGSLYEEVEDRLHYLESMEKLPRKMTMAEFQELKRARSLSPELSTSEHHGGRPTSLRTEVTHVGSQRDSAAQ